MEFRCGLAGCQTRKFSSSTFHMANIYMKYYSLSNK